MTVAHDTKHWRVLALAPDGAVEAKDAPPAIRQVLYHRGLFTKEAIDAFLNPGPKWMHDPCLLPDMDTALDRLQQAVAQGETVGILGDFDVDGVTGTALLALALGQLGVTVVPYLPHRVREGHGPNPGAIHSLREQGCTLMITVDCGVNDLEEVDLASRLGMHTIITDHHTPRPQLPHAVAVINPKVAPSPHSSANAAQVSYPFVGLSGAGLAFKLVHGLYRRMGLPCPPDLIALAAIGTVADVSPLLDENRYLVQAGLRALATTRHPGLLALYRRAGLNPQGIGMEAISFAISPRLNSAGRLDSASTSYRLLTSTDYNESEELSLRLEEMNLHRRQETERSLTAAQERVMQQANLPSILLVGEDWYHPGIVGLTAGQLAERFNRPAIAMCLSEDVVRASARSIPQFNMVRALEQCGDLFLRYGGHPQAAGFTMKRENLESLYERMEALADEELAGMDLRPSIRIDAEAPVTSLMGAGFEWLRALGPFGEGNPAPTFMARNLEVREVRPLGNSGQHLKLKLRENRATFDAAAFGLAERWTEGVDRIDAVYRLETERRGGAEVVSLRLLDFSDASGASATTA